MLKPDGPASSRRGRLRGFLCSGSKRRLWTQGATQDTNPEEIVPESNKEWLKDSNIKKEREQNDEKSHGKKNKPAVFSLNQSMYRNKCQMNDQSLFSPIFLKQLINTLRCQSELPKQNHMRSATASESRSFSKPRINCQTNANRCQSPFDFLSFLFHRHQPPSL